MYNNDEKISASEINKYCYCQYSWYYERLYGKKYITEMYKERNEKLGLTDKTIHNFKRGVDFHDKFLIRRKIRIIIRFILFVIFISIFIFIILWLKKCGLL